MASYTKSDAESPVEFWIGLVYIPITGRGRVR